MRNHVHIRTEKVAFLGDQYGQDRANTKCCKDDISAIKTATGNRQECYHCTFVRLFNPNNIFFNTNLLSILYSSLDQHTILCTDSHLKIYTVQTPQNVENMHRSNAEHLIDAMPIIDVHGGVAVCDGGGGALGHPIEYIQLNMVEEGVENECKYCGLRFRSVGGHH